MSNGAKVVQLNAAPAARPLSVERKVHSGLLPLLEQARPFLSQALQAVFDAVDDSLFEMSERSANNAEREAQFEVMRTLRLKRKDLEQAVLGSLGRAFGEVGAVQLGAMMDVLPAGLLTLMDNDELEETVAVKTMVARTLSENGTVFNQLQQRMQALLGSPLTEDNNPLSARMLCSYFTDVLRPLGLKIQVRLVLLKLYEKHLLKNIGDLYAEANDHLIAAGVLPDLRRPAPRPSARPTASAPGAAQGSAEPWGADAAPSDAQAVLGQLRELLAQTRGDQAPGRALPADAVPVSQGDLTRLLSHLQHQAPSADEPLNVQEQLNALLARASANSPRPRVIGRQEEDVITLVSMLFERMLADDALPDPMKGHIGALQVPLLKAAILDQQLFGEQAHPARRLLNEVTLAARGSEELAVVQRDRLQNKIGQLSERLRNEFTDDPRVFADLLDDFSRFNESEHRRAALLEQRLLEAEEARAQRDKARQQVDRLLGERLQELTLPAAIVQGLERGWGGVLQLILLREGEGTAEWDKALATLDELLGQVAPLRNVEQARLLLGPRRLELFEEVRRGLELVAYDAFELQRFLQALTQWQRQLLTDFKAGVVPSAAPVAREAEAASMAESASASMVPSAAEPEAAVAAEESVPGAVRADDAAPAAVLVAGAEVGPEIAEIPGEQPLFEMLEVAQVVAVASETEMLDEPLAITGLDAEPEAGEEHFALVDNLGVGSWIELAASEGNKQRCKLAAFIRASGQFIFVNRAGAKVAAFGRLELAQNFARGIARLMDNAQPFDRALQAIIGNLRELRGA